MAPPSDDLTDGLVEVGNILGRQLVVSSGSVVDAHVDAIVNAADERCLGGSGVSRRRPKRRRH